MHPYEAYLDSDPRDLDARVERIRNAIEVSVQRRSTKHPNDANVQHMQAFVEFLQTRFPTGRFRAETQAIPKKHIRTTDRNFIVTVPGESPDSIVLVAHYDTWAGLSRNAPGADDNSTGEEVLKHYLLRDLGARTPPLLTHVYVFAGSEECGTRGLVSQLGLTVALSLASLAISTGNLWYVVAAAPFAPLANYRFGITGTRHFVTTLSEAEKLSIRAAIAVDSVGEGELYIPENEMGANFIRALFPFEGSERLNDLLEEAAHLHHIKYNRFIAGGTTDSVAFLEERRTVPGGPSEARKEHIPAAALITMSPGKCSPFVAGGKLHTSTDTPDRVFPRPLIETLTVLDYAIHVLEGGERPAEPRQLSQHHYARLYRDGDDFLVALKDAVEPNQRNINTIFRARGQVVDKTARLTVEESLGWGVETSLDREINDLRPSARRVAVDEIQIEHREQSLRFVRAGGSWRNWLALLLACLGGAERWIGRYSFVTMFATAIVVAYIPTTLIEWGASRILSVGRFVSDHYPLTVVGVILFQLAALFRLFTRDLPSWMDNAYDHQNRADNLRSLRRASTRAP